MASPSPEHQQLAIFIGTWSTEGDIAAGPSTPPSRLRATDIYEWGPGKRFLIHSADGHMGDDEVQALEIIGHDAEKGAYFTHAFDNQGNVANYQARLEHRAWFIDGATERFSGRFNDSGTQMSGNWERRADDGSWSHWMAITLTKAT